MLRLLLVTLIVSAVAAGLAALAWHRRPPRPPAEIATQTQPPIQGPLHVSTENPRYFATPNGEAVLLVGAHTWDNFQDILPSGRSPAFDYARYLAFLALNHHNFFRLWRWEQTRWSVEPPGEFTTSPQPWKRVGPGNALDGKPRFDLQAFNEDYFVRLRQRVMQARDQGIYVSVMLFNGWSVEKTKGRFAVENPWHGHPFNKANNVNGIDGDGNGDDSGAETHTMANPAVTALQEAYVRKVIDTVNDLDNVLYEISNESGTGSADWQVRMIRLIHDYEAQKPKRHPVGMTAIWPGGTNSELLASPAEWISPNGTLPEPPAASGDKVILADTDHLCGVCGDGTWPWRSLLRGQNPIFMDPYEGATGIDPDVDPQERKWAVLRANLGYARIYSRRVRLAAMTPHGELASTGFCLASPTDAGAYLVLIPEGRELWVDATSTPGTLMVEWLEVRSGAIKRSPPVEAGRRLQLTSPFAGPAVLYLASQH